MHVDYIAEIWVLGRSRAWNLACSYSGQDRDEVLTLAIAHNFNGGRIGPKARACIEEFTKDCEHTRWLVLRSPEKWLRMYPRTVL